MKNKSQTKPSSGGGWLKNEDWLAVVISFALILLSVIGVLGKNGIPIKF